MNYRFTFSCDEARINLADFISKGYGVWFDKCDGKAVRIDVGENNQNHVSLLLHEHEAAANIRRTDTVYWLKFDYTCEIVSDNRIIIPAQTNVIYESDIHPLDEKYIFPHLSNVGIIQIEITNTDNDYETYCYSNEKDLVLDLLLERIPSDVKPISQYGQDMYNHIKEIAQEYIRQRNKETVDYMVSLINQLDV